MITVLLVLLIFLVLESCYRNNFSSSSSSDASSYADAAEIAEGSGSTASSRHNQHQHSPPDYEPPPSYEEMMASGELYPPPSEDRKLRALQDESTYDTLEGHRTPNDDQPGYFDAVERGGEGGRGHRRTSADSESRYYDALDGVNEPVYALDGYYMRDVREATHNINNNSVNDDAHVVVISVHSHDDDNYESTSRRGE